MRSVSHSGWNQGRPWAVKENGSAKSKIPVCAIQRPLARCHQRSEPCIVVKPKDQQVKMTASHQRRATDRGSGWDVAGDLPLLPGAARPGGVGFFLALAFRIPA